jgi:non-ribosomal peptide synthetase component F
VEIATNPRSYENFEMFINATVINEKIILECQYNTNLFDAKTIRDRLAEFETLLTNIVEYPELKISELSLLPESEKEILQQWNKVTKGEYPKICLHQLFEEQVKKLLMKPP